ncbi:hypothetical protein MRB53_032043 [Persea americana]|uniref:Uncharacterized protein n=1 Tax=Persea americana TaxID=3435 RepID=A0ACC2KQP9_PERAE|nr:hypothetical protein MRB53_032043 [Persea americana]
MPGLTIGDAIPNLEVNTTHGKFKIHDFVGDGWAIIFSHPGDFTPVCTTELAKMAQYQEEFEKRGVQLLGLSCDDLQSHTEWIRDIEAFAGVKLSFLHPASTGRNMDEGCRLPSESSKAQGGNSLQLEARGTCSHFSWGVHREDQGDVSAGF